MENELIKNSPPAGLGRNSPCFCGSGKKYKKCCLSLNTYRNAEFLKQTSLDKLKEKNSGDSLVDAEQIGVAKMSEIILEYANDLLEMSPTTTDKKRAVLVAVTAWNFSLLPEEGRQSAINLYLGDIMKIKKSSEAWHMMQDLIKVLIEKRLEEYYEFDRFIADYDFIQISKNSFHLNVISSLIVD